MKYSKTVVPGDEHGQVLLIIVLVMVVALTVGLSLASRSLVQVKTTADQADSQKAFSAAEAGIEQSLQTGKSITAAQSLGNNSTINNVSVNTVGGQNNFVLNNGDPVRQDDGIDVWLSDYSDDPTKIYLNPWSGTFTLYWGTDSSDACNNPALEIVVLKGTVASPTMDHYAIDPCSSRRTNNHFTAPSAGGTAGGQSYLYSTAITIPAASPGPGLFARVIPLYKDGSIGVVSTVNLPAQGKIISSTGTAGATQRKITLFQGYQSVPTEFFYSLFSPK